MTTASVPALTELTGTYTLDPAHTRIGFVARHAMVTKVRGSFNEFEGTATLDGANPANSRAEVTIKAHSIDTRNAQRDGCDDGMAPSESESSRSRGSASRSEMSTQPWRRWRSQRRSVSKCSP